MKKPTTNDDDQGTADDEPPTKGSQGSADAIEPPTEESRQHSVFERVNALNLMPVMPDTRPAGAACAPVSREYREDQQSKRMALVRSGQKAEFEAAAAIIRRQAEIKRTDRQTAKNEGSGQKPSA